ncbi:MAG TPA: VCBS repeat-containing protein [Flavitalea sp.]|nr:VCBS repeat-containing protein [Flavitalea sp.]
MANCPGKNFLAWLTLGVFTLVSCSDKQESITLFTEIPSSQSKVLFRNEIQEDENYNIDTYEYLYNGGGVATADLNNDGLNDLVFSGNMTQSKIYINKGNLQFEDVTGQTGFADRGKWKTGIAVADVNGDQLPDLYLCYSGPGTDEQRSNELYINTGTKDGIPHFKESAAEYGLDAPGTYTTMVAFFDMDKDGDLDLFMVNHADMFYNPFFNSDKLRITRHPKFGNRLYKNDNGHYTDISEQAHIHGSGLNFGLSVAVSDINSDSWPDLYVTNDYDESDFLYINNHDGTFKETLNTSAQHISEFSMGSDIADYNNDGKPDLVVLDMLPEDNYRQKVLKGPDGYDKYMMRVKLGYHRQQMRNVLQLNNGNDLTGAPVFSEIGQLAGISNTDWSWAPLFADFDNDGWKDLFISNGILRDMTNLDFVKYSITYSSKSKNRTQDKSKMWQLIRDLPTEKLHNYVFQNNRDLSFKNVTTDWGITKSSVNNGAAYADLDNDGDLDLVINNLNDEATIYRNNSSETKNGHYLRIRLAGQGKNTQAIGARVLLKTNTAEQVQEQYINRGFQSTVDGIMHFGTGADSVISSIIVEWPGGGTTRLSQVRADTLITVTQPPRDSIESTRVIPKEPMFEDVTAQSGIDFTHFGPQFVDFKIFPLLPFQLSKTGPCLGKADVNSDGLEDIFIGASSGQESKLYLQSNNGKFILSKSQPWNNQKEFTTTDALFFDADGDGDADLYLVSGGAEFNSTSKNYQDRLFENDGKGNFSFLADALPAETLSGSCARAADIDNNGTLDIFVGSMVKPGFFPVPPESFVLKNLSVKGKIHFVKDSLQLPSAMNNLGMISDAVWIDINKDGWQDLLVAGQFMPIMFLENHKGILDNATASFGLAETDGWWRRILADDFDNDGDTDFVLGNLGLNSSFKATVKEPLSIVYGEFYTPGVINPVLTYYNNGKNYPWYSKDEMAEQMPVIQKKFLMYKDYAQAQLTDIFTKEQLDKSSSVKAGMLESVYLQNNSNKNFSTRRLPNYAQLSALNGMVSVDIDGDGSKDIIAGGNLYPFRAQLGPLDASIGIVLKGNGKGDFTPIPFDQSGLLLQGDIRNIISVRSKQGLLLIAAKNEGEVQVVQLRNQALEKRNIN